MRSNAGHDCTMRNFRPCVLLEFLVCGGGLLLWAVNILLVFLRDLVCLSFQQYVGAHGKNHSLNHNRRDTFLDMRKRSRILPNF